MRDSYPTWTIVELVRMCQNWICLSTLVGTVSAILAIVGTFYILGSQHTSVVSHRKFIVGQKKIIVAIVIYDLRSFRCLPATIDIASIDTFAIFADVSPWGTDNSHKAYLYSGSGAWQQYQNAMNRR